MWCLTKNVVFPDCAGVWLFLAVLILTVIVGVIVFAVRHPNG